MPKPPTGKPPTRPPLSTGKRPERGKPRSLVLRRPVVLASDQPEAFVLSAWYSSEDAKRRLGAICQGVNLQGREVGLLGSSEKPLLVLADADLHAPTAQEVELSIDEARADWSSVTDAAALYGTRFRIRGRKVPRAVLMQHPDHRHPALKYFRGHSVEITTLADRFNELVDELRKLKSSLGKLSSLERIVGDQDALTDRLERSAEIIEARFREIWRSSPGNLAPSPAYRS